MRLTEAMTGEKRLAKGSPTIAKNARRGYAASSNPDHDGLGSGSRRLAAADVANTAAVGVSQVLRLEFHQAHYPR